MDLPDHAPLLAFVAQTRPGVRAMLSRYRIPPSDADDVVQEALLALVAKWANIEHPLGWFFTVLQRQCWSCLAHRRRFTAVDPDQLIAMAGVTPAPEKPILARIDVTRLVARLPRRQQRVLYLRHYLGLTLSELALVSRERTKTALARDVLRARVRVRELIGGIEAKKRRA